MRETIKIIIASCVMVCAAPAFAQESQTGQTHDNASTDERQLSPLPKVADLEVAAKIAPMTLEKCEATADAYSEPTAPMVQSISDERLHDLNVQSFACMKLGGRGVRYGYQLKNLVDTVVGVYALSRWLQNQQKDSVRVASDLLGKVVDHNNALVDKYNRLAAKYNALLGTAQAITNFADELERANSQMYTLAAQALNTAGYSQPVIIAPNIPRTAYVPQSPLHCTTQAMPAVVPGLASFAYTNCF